ncbi:MAG: class I SAM-dependent methyltransferase [Candidatus Methanoperedens sp.]|nr:class I SAM-dependent methyltransferase [Candidatus Methanoperedens sp.]
MIFMKNMAGKENKWDNLHSSERFRPKYPSEHCVRFIFTQFPREFDKRKNIKILDLGCGAGRHTIFLAQEGFGTYATDFSEEGLIHLRKDVADKKLTATLYQADMEKQPFPDNFFDGIISFGVFYYANLESYKNAVSEMYRMLKKGGKALIFTRTDDDYRFGKGRKLEKNTYILDIEDTNEKGMINHFLDRDEINEIFCQFNIINVEKTETTFSNSQKKNSDWIIIVEKQVQ